MKNENVKTFSFISLFKALCCLYIPSYIYLLINFKQSVYNSTAPCIFYWLFDWNSCQLICQLADLLKLSWKEKCILSIVYQTESAFGFWIDWFIGLLSFNRFMWVKAEVFHNNIAIFHTIWIVFFDFNHLYNLMYDIDFITVFSYLFCEMDRT